VTKLPRTGQLANMGKISENHLLSSVVIRWPVASLVILVILSLAQARCSAAMSSTPSRALSHVRVAPSLLEFLAEAARVLAYALVQGLGLGRCHPLGRGSFPATSALRGRAAAKCS
jgi:hypothetical protein